MEIPEEFLQVKIADVSITNLGFAILFRSTDSKLPKLVPIFIGPLEIYSISSVLDGVISPRPGTHDLLVNILNGVNAKVAYVVISDVVGPVFYARIMIQVNEGLIELDSRPSDAVALAVRTKCPIYMHEKVYKETAIIIAKEKVVKEEDIFKKLRNPVEIDDIRGLEEDGEFSDISLIKKGARKDAKKKIKPTIRTLKLELDKAVDREDFEKAAILRDRIKKLEEKDA